MCAGPGPEAVALQCAATVALGGQAVCINGVLDPMDLHDLPPFGGLIWWGEETAARAYAEALSQRQGPIIPLITGHPDKAHACLERHLCVDTTAAGGNAALLAGERSNPRRVA